MAADPARFRGKETTSLILGVTWTFSRFSIDIWEPFLDWAATVLPDPIDVALQKVNRLADEYEKVKNDASLSDSRRGHLLLVNGTMQGAVTKIAMDEALSYLSPGSPRVQSLMRSPRGGAHLLRGLLTEHHPAVTLEECGWMIQEMEDAELERIIRVTSGKLGPAGN